MRTLFYPLLITFLLLMNSCGSEDYNEIRYIQYGFEDASKSPEYRRDYVIQIAPTEASAEITNGDSLLAVGNFQLAPGQFDSIIKVTGEQYLFTVRSEHLKPDCGGCNTQSLVFMDSTRNVLKEIKWNGGLAPREVLIFKEKMMDEIENFNILLQSTFPVR